jgi:tetratricopeptide (TPR) repeat protein
VEDEPTAPDAGSSDDTPRASKNDRRASTKHSRARPPPDETDERRDEPSSKDSLDAGVVAANTTSADAGVALPHPSTLSMPASNESGTNITQAWQARLDRLHAGDEVKVKQEEDILLNIKKSLGITNLLGPATALTREADEATRDGRGSEAKSRCEKAVAFAPDFNVAYFCVARTTLYNDPLSMGVVFGALRKAITATMSDVRSRRNAITNSVLTLLFGFALACGILVLLLIFRYGRLSLHDFHHLFPAAVPQWQTVLVAVVMLVLPALLGMGVFGSVAVAAIAVAVTAGRAEAVALAVAFLLLAAAQYAADDVMRAGAFGRLAQDVYLLERGDAPETSAVRLAARADQGLGDYATAYALGRYYRRMGKYAEAKEAYNAAQKLRSTAEVMNNIGNVELLSGDPDAAVKSYLESNANNGSLAAPHLNLAKIYFKQTKEEDGEKELRLAREADPEWTAKYINDIQQNLADDSKPIDLPLSDEIIAGLADREGAAVMPKGGATWAALTGRLSEAAVVWIALLTAVLIAVAQVFQRQLRPSSRCERCGRAVCSRCDPELGTTVGMCGQCISVFVRRTGVDAPVRIRKEIEVRRFRKRRQLSNRFVGTVIGGGGHILAGQVVVGVGFLIFFSLLLADVIFWDGVLRSPVPVDLTPSNLHIGIYVLAFLLLAGLSLWHLVRSEEAD